MAQTAAVEVAARTAGIEDAFTAVLVPALAAGTDEDEARGVGGYLASTFVEDVRLRLHEPEVDVGVAAQVEMGGSAPDASAEAATAGDGGASSGSSVSGSEADSDASASGAGSGAGAGAGAGGATKAGKRGKRGKRGKGGPKLTKEQRKARRAALKRKGGQRAALGEGTFHVRRSRQLGFEQAQELLQASVPDALLAAGADDAGSETVIENLLRALVVRGVVRDVDDDGWDVVVEASERKLEQHEVTEGAACLALLAEDDKWHAATVDAILQAGKRFRVVFDEYGKPQEVTRTQLVLDVDRADLEELGDGICAMCERETPLTAHHLIPRCTHTKWRKKGLTQEFLNTCVDICRACHNVVHRFKDNETLGEKYNTLELLLEQEYIQRWIAYAKTQPARTRAERDAKLRLAK